MFAPIRFEPASSWLRTDDTFNNDYRVLAQFVDETPVQQPAASAPLIPDVALDPANPNQLQPQAGVVTIDLHPQIERGLRPQTNAIVLHMTNANEADTLSGYDDAGANGAHFLVTLDGRIIQTAGLDQRTPHVGLPRPKGYVPAAEFDGNRRVNEDLTPESELILDSLEADEISNRAANEALADLEFAKPYGEIRTDETTRGPVNRDSIGIEFERISVDGVYPSLTDEQRAAGMALLNVLMPLYGLDAADVYEHPDIAYKNYSEAQGARDQILYYGGE